MSRSSEKENAPNAAQVNDLAMETFKFAVRAPDEAAMLLKEYSSKSGAKKDRDLFVSESEIMALNKDLDKSRAALVTKKLLNIHAEKKPEMTAMFSDPNAAASEPAYVPPQILTMSQAEIKAMLGKWSARINEVGPPMLSIYNASIVQLGQAKRMVTLI